MGNPYISPISRGYLWVSYPQESLETNLLWAGDVGFKKGVPLRIPIPFIIRGIPTIEATGPQKIQQLTITLT